METHAMHSRALIFGLVTAAVLILSACSSSDEDTIRIYTGRHYDLEEAFTQYAEETGVSIEFLEGSDAELRERIAAEGEDTEADIYMTVDAGNLAIATQQGIFQEIDSPVLDDAIPEALRDPDGYWYAFSARARTIVYSPERVSAEELPTTYEELAQPEWQGRVCLRNSSNTYTQSLVASLIGNVGYDEALTIVSGWADNAEILPNDVIALNSVADGLCDVAIVNHYYLARLLEDDGSFPVELVWADQAGRGTHVNISGAGVTKFADDPQLAQDFLEWLGTEGQSAFVDGNHEYPVNPDVAPEALIATTFGETFVADDLNAAEFGSLNADAVRLLDEAGYE
ncbi:MAG: extracellular solute-binding protein [Actinomycetota bacterium]